MLTPHEAGGGGHEHEQNKRGRKTTSRLLSEVWKRKKRQPFKPNFVALEQRRLMATFLVNTNADSGVESLRQAILDSNSMGPGPNTIDFGIGSGAQTISLLSALPSITVPVLIDGTSQPGYAGAPLIDFDGTSAAPARRGWTWPPAPTAARSLRS